jgi:hypothetical protein
MTPLLTRQTIWIVGILLGGSLGLTVARAQDQQSTIVAPGTDATNKADIAAGSVEDTIRDCMGRIPKDASIGQVMIAEQSCWRDENERKPVQAIPGARSTGLTSPAEHRSVVKSADRASVVVSE